MIRTTQNQLLGVVGCTGVLLMVGFCASLAQAQPAYPSQTGELERGKALALVRVVATRKERRAMRRLRADDGTAFLEAFWEKRDPHPDSPGNQYRLLMESRALEADSRFQEGLVSGIETDRGRIFLLYGEPGTIEQVEHHPRRKPHEVWRYDPAAGDAGAMCVFWDRDGFGVMTLLHSTFPGDPYRPEWRELLSGRR